MPEERKHMSKPEVIALIASALANGRAEDDQDTVERAERMLRIARKRVEQLTPILHAAAPRLYTALDRLEKASVAYASTPAYSPSWETAGKEFREALSEARAAMAEARGEK
jgi:methylphosphotriester-DNA--protein-cysteine methyltransferase